MLESLKTTDIPFAAITLAVIGWFVLMLAFFIFAIFRIFFPSAMELMIFPLLLLFVGYLSLFLIYRHARRDLGPHNVSTYWLGYVHGVMALTLLFMTLGDEMLAKVAAAGTAILLLSFYLCYFALCLLLWTRPTWPSLTASAGAIISLIFALRRF